MVMAIVGGAFFPPIMGLIAESAKSMAVAMVIPLICYLYIAYYAFKGSKIPNEHIEEMPTEVKILSTH